MRGEGPVVLVEPHPLQRAFRLFSPRIDLDWPEILAKIPVGYGLEVPVSRETVGKALWRLKKTALVKPYEYAANRTTAGHCIIYHVKPLLGEPFPLERIYSRLQGRKYFGYWNDVILQVMSGRTVNVKTPYSVAYMSLRKRIRQCRISLDSITFEKTVDKRGKECVRIRGK